MVGTQHPLLARRESVLPKLEATPKEETIRILIADDDPMIPDMLSERLPAQHRRRPCHPAHDQQRREGACALV